MASAVRTFPVVTVRLDILTCVIGPNSVALKFARQRANHYAQPSISFALAKLDKNGESIAGVHDVILRKFGAIE